MDNYNIKSKLGTYYEEIKIGKRTTDISPNEAYMPSHNPSPAPIELSQLLKSGLLTNELPFS
jgi:hypothetical protein